MEQRTIRILILEDMPENAELMARILRGYGFNPVYKRVDNEDDYIANLKPDLEVILSEYKLRHLTALKALHLLKQKELEIPFLVVTESINEEEAVDLLRQGAEDYLLKDRLIRLGPAINRALEQKTVRLGKNKAEKELQESEKLYRTIAETAADAIICIEEPDKVYFWNRKAEEMLGYSSSEVMGKALHDFVVPERYYRRAIRGVKNFFQTGTGPNIGRTVEFQALRRDKTEFPIELSISSMHIGGKWKAVGIIRDITERKRMEEENLKIHKLEALSLLAGGIAHDFNNMLTNILWNIELADTVKDSAEGHKKLLEAQKVILKTKNLSQQLITFAKGGAPLKKVLSVKDIIRESLCQNIMAANIECDLICPEDTWLIEADEVQISQVLNNIILNAEQAMPEGGRIEIRCANEFLGKGNIFHLKEGEYVRISIKDTGPGIPKENLKRLFEPYYTTKQRGSGLGLALAYSIIKNHNGFITVESEVNVGTIFYLYLPISEREPAALSPNGKKKVLVLEDDVEIGRLLSSLLDQAGYSVVLSREGEDTIFKYKDALEAGKSFDTVIIDLSVHDGMEGKEAIRELVDIDPNIKAIATSSFNAEEVIADYKKYGFRAALHKPYSITELNEILLKLRED
ncbi:MAG: PAS domain S-box protein [Deltaproteobacteria bacterium]|nr:PAS domain S-box protein [Deltaproteobacteria bacterium]